MKNLKLFSLVFLLIAPLFITGCYTQLAMRGENTDERDYTYQDNNQDDSYYDNDADSNYVENEDYYYDNEPGSLRTVAVYNLFNIWILIRIHI